MDFLFDNPLANLYGPYFLVFYSFFIVSSIIAFAFAKSRLDQSERFALPPIPPNPDAFEIAYLRGGANELARTAIFSLTQKNLLKIVNEDKNSRIEPTKIEFDRNRLSTIEMATLSWFRYSRDVKEIFAANGLTEQLRSFSESYQAQLEMHHLLVDDDLIAKTKSWARRAFLIFGALGAYKFAAAIYNGYFNILGIIFVTIIGLAVLAWTAKTSRLTNLGKQYLERLRLAFERIKPSNHFPASNQTAFAAVDPFLLSVGVFGGAALAGTVYSDYNLAFQKAQNQSSASSGSCGSGCGSGSCSSGGDGGGSGCGSGCGGCGGGCGG